MLSSESNTLKQAETSMVGQVGPPGHIIHSRVIGGTQTKQKGEDRLHSECGKLRIQVDSEHVTTTFHRLPPQLR